MTRRKYEVRDSMGNVLWDVLAERAPDPSVTAPLDAVGITVGRTLPRSVAYRGPQWSASDPVNSVLAAMEHCDRTDAKRWLVLRLLLVRNGDWVSRDEVRKYGGDSGDRRVRELRDEGNWPVEIKQLTKRSTWHVRLNLDPTVYTSALQIYRGMSV